MDKIVDMVAALGIPGLVLVIAIAVAGPAGGAAIMWALAFLGGPLGALGGIAVLILISIISKAIAEYGAVAVAKAVVERLRDKGHTHEEIRRKIAGYPISRGLKAKLLVFLDSLRPCEAERPA